MRGTRGVAALLIWLGTTSPAPGAQIQVPAGGSINAGLASAAPGDTVCVQAGTYYEEVALVPGVALLGGFDAGFGWPPDPDANVTMIHGEGVRSCIVSGAGSDSSTIVDGFTMRGAGGSPGAAVRVTGGSPVFSHNDISGNRQAGIAGGVWIRGGSTARFTDNELRQNSSGGSGGAFRIEDSSPVIEGNLLEGNVARNAGGGFYVLNSTLTATDNTIRDGLAGTGGGAAFFFQECPAGGVVSGTVIEDCEAGHGGAILLRDESSVTFEGAVIRRCAATSPGGGYGGGAFVLGFSTVVLNEARFEDCSATADGGGLYVHRSTFRVTGTDASSPQSASAFVNCTSQRRGGAIWAFAAADTALNRVNGVRFSDCSARDEGGAFFFDECAVRFTKNLVERCSASHGGGGALRTTVTFSPPRTVLANNTFHECSATLDPSGNPGGALALMGPNSSNLALVAGNIISKTLSGACVACTGGSGSSTPTIVCSTMSRDPGNTSALTGGQTCTNSWAAGAGNAERDPGYCSPDPIDYALSICGSEPNCPEAMDLTMAVQRGVTDACGCGPVSAVEESSWGQIKARYRR